MGAFDHIDLHQAPLYEQIADQMEEMFVKGGMSPGDRLPAERDLAEALGVSRTVIRDATKLLQQRGLIRSVTGSGTYISNGTSQMLQQSTSRFVRHQMSSFSDLAEVRMMMEVEIAGLAAERASQEDIETLETAVVEMEQTFSNVRSNQDALELFLEAHLRIHKLLVKSCRNGLLETLYLAILDSILEYSRAATIRPGAPESSVACHRALLECIKLRDRHACQTAMRAHMQLVLDADWLEARPSSDPHGGHNDPASFGS